MDYYKIVEELKTVVDWSGKYSKFIPNIALDKGLNVPSKRFLKSELQLVALQHYSNDKILYVDQDGYDLIYNDCKIEDKSMENMFHSKPTKKNILGDEKRIVNVMMTNTMPSEYGFDVKEYLENKKYDILLLRQTRKEASCLWVGSVNPALLKNEHVLVKPGQIQLNIPREMIDWIFRGTNKTFKSSTILPSLFLKNAMKDFISMNDLQEQENCYDNNYCI